MFQCHVCGCQSYHQGEVDEVFIINGKVFLMEKIPVKICSNCEEMIFSRETTEKIRKKLHGEKPIKSMMIDVFAY